MLLPPSVNIVLEVLTEELKLSLPKDNITVYTGNPNASTEERRKERERGVSREGMLLLSKFMKIDV